MNANFVIVKKLEQSGIGGWMIRKAIRNGELKAFQSGRPGSSSKYLIDPEEFEKWVEKKIRNNR